MLSDKSPEVLVQVCRMFIDGLMSQNLKYNSAVSFRPKLEWLITYADPTVRTLAENMPRTLDATSP
jgi:hypothetical protein